MKINKTLSIAFLAIIFLSSCNNSGINVKDDQELKFVQRENRIIKGSGEDVQIYVGDVTMGTVQVKITGMDDQKLYFDKEMNSINEGYFKYGSDTYYRIKVNKFENHLLHDDYAFISFRKVGEEIASKNITAVSQNDSPAMSEAEVNVILEKVKNSSLQFVRNGEMLSDTAMAVHLAAKYVMNQPDIKTQDDFYNRIVTKSMESGKEYKVIKNGDTLRLVDWIREN